MTNITTSLSSEASNTIERRHHWTTGSYKGLFILKAPFSFAIKRARRSFQFPCFFSFFFLTSFFKYNRIYLELKYNHLYYYFILFFQIIVLARFPYSLAHSYDSLFFYFTHIPFLSLSLTFFL